MSSASSSAAAGQQTNKPGFFHSIKEMLFHGEHHVDSDFDASLHKFQILEQTALKLRTSVNNYSASLYSTLLNSNNTAIDFSLTLEDTAVDNDYQRLCHQLKAAHAKLNSQQQAEITNRLAERVLKPLEEQLNHYTNINARIQHRNQLHGNLEYYLNKVTGLLKERDGRGVRGQGETPKNQDKTIRNQQKLEVARQEYQTYTTTLIADMTNTWNQRVAVLGPALASFIEVEKLYVKTYANALSEVSNSRELEQAPAGITPERVLPKDIGLAPAAQPLAIAPNTTLGVMDPMLTHPSNPIVQEPSSTASSTADAAVDTMPAPAQVSTYSAPIPMPLATAAAPPPPMLTFDEYQKQQGKQFETGSTNQSDAAVVTQMANSNPFDEPVKVAASGAGAGAQTSSSPIVTSNNAPSPPVDPAPTQSEIAPHQVESLESAIPAASAKMTGEEESKRQRYEQDQKTQAVSY